MNAYGRAADARLAYGEAAAYEEQALVALEGAKHPQTYGVVAVSAVALYFKAGELGHAKRLALRCLQNEELPDFAENQLFEILSETYNRTMALDDHNSDGSESAVIDASLRGDYIGFGEAPLDIVIEHLSGIERLFYRTVELQGQMEFRISGPPPAKVKSICRTVVSQPRGGSYKFSLRIDPPAQLPLFSREELAPDAIAEKFVRVVSTITHGNKQIIREEIPNERYREVMVKLIRNIVPDGVAVREIEFRETGRTGSRVAVLHESDRVSIQTALAREGGGTEAKAIESRAGVLRAVHLDQRWLAITDANDGTLRCSLEHALVVDDVVGPMVNKQVIVSGRWVGRARPRFVLYDIDFAPRSYACR